MRFSSLVTNRYCLLTFNIGRICILTIVFQSKLAQENLLIPRIYYPWIRGPNNETVDALAAETGAKINIPPPAAQNEMIVITGEKEGVHRAAAAIKNIYEEKLANAKSVTCQVRCQYCFRCSSYPSSGLMQAGIYSFAIILVLNFFFRPFFWFFICTVFFKVPKPQHRYIIGPQRKGLTEILKETGVSVEVPPEEENSHTITLRGDQDKLGPALALVYAKASSVITVEITCKPWMHKYLIGPKGTTLQVVYVTETYYFLLLVFLLW